MMTMLSGAIQPVRSVEDAATLLKRAFVIERETLRAMGAWHINLADWPTKCALPRHLYHVAQHANLLRERVLELRYPRRDVDTDHSPALIAFLGELPRAQTDAEFLIGLYHIMFPALIDAYQSYLSASDPLDDAPTHYWLPRVIAEIEADRDEGQALLAELSEAKRSAAQAWGSYLARALAAVGGVLGTASVQALPADDPCAGRPPYQVPLIARRDPRFTPAIVHMPRQAPATPSEEQIFIGINHANEMWAAETPGTLMWHWPDMPWAFYLDAARWAYDESRHALMGLRRMEAWGFEPGIDFPLVADHYNSVSAEGPLILLALLHHFETAGPAWKQGLKRRYEELGDTASAQDCDYDWADEAIHLKYGHTWLRYHLGEHASTELPALLQRANELWKTWLAAQWADGNDPYAAFQPRLDAKLAAKERQA